MFAMRRNLVIVAAGPETTGGSPGPPGVSPSADGGPGPPHPGPRGQWWALSGSRSVALWISHRSDVTLSALKKYGRDTVYRDNVKFIIVSFKSQHDGVKKYSVHNHILLSVDTKYFWSSRESQWRLQWCSCQDWGWCQWMWCCGGKSEKVPFLLLRCFRFGLVRWEKSKWYLALSKDFPIVADIIVRWEFIQLLSAQISNRLARKSIWSIGRWREKYFYGST